MARELKPCGTRAGYDRHISRREAPCEMCRNANAAYQREYRATVPAYLMARYVAREAARCRAKVRVGADHPDRLEELAQEIQGDNASAALRHRARVVARTRLAHEHPDEFAEIFAEELAREGERS